MPHRTEGVLPDNMCVCCYDGSPSIGLMIHFQGYLEDCDRKEIFATIPFALQGQPPPPSLLQIVLSESKIYENVTGEEGDAKRRSFFVYQNF